MLLRHAQGPSTPGDPRTPVEDACLEERRRGHAIGDLLGFCQEAIGLGQFTVETVDISEVVPRY